MMDMMIGKEYGFYIGTIFVLLLCLVLKRLFCRPSIVKRKPKQGIWGYFVCYADQAGVVSGKREDFGKVIYSTRYDLQGKPDYIFQRYVGRRLVPVEIKSGSIGEGLYPHDGDRLQLAVYFLIIEDVYGVKPKEGRLIYSDAMFIIKNTKRIRMEAANTILDMRRMLQDGKGEPSPSYVHCRYCLCRRTVCEFCEYQ